MSNVRPVEERHARLYLHLAERFGWTPEQINELDPSVRVAMAKVLNLPPHDDAPAEDDKQPADDAPAEPEGLAEWERELLDRQENEPLTDAEMRAKVRSGEWTVNRYRDAVGFPPVAPSATTSAQDAGITLNVHLDGKRIYDAIRPHAEAEAERAWWRLRNGNWPLT